MPGDIFRDKQTRRAVACVCVCVQVYVCICVSVCVCVSRHDYYQLYCAPFCSHHQCLTCCSRPYAVISKCSKIKCAPENMQQNCALWCWLYTFVYIAYMCVRVCITVTITLTKQNTNCNLAKRDNI